MWVVIGLTEDWDNGAWRWTAYEGVSRAIGPFADEASADAMVEALNATRAPEPERFGDHGREGAIYWWAYELTAPTRALAPVTV